LNLYKTNNFIPKTTNVDKVVQSFSGLRNISKPRLLSDKDYFNQQTRTKILKDETQKFIYKYWISHSTQDFRLFKAATKPVTNESILFIIRGAQCF